MKRWVAERVRQRGIASIIITMLVMVIISLIVLGFATISRREQRQSLDRQLSTQAFYAAESGIEDARNVIKASLASGVSFRKDNCAGNNGPGFAVYPTVVSGATRLNVPNRVSYTCLTVNDQPESAQFNGVGNGNLVVPIKVDPSGAAIDELTIRWSPDVAPAISPANCPTSTINSLRPQASWKCGYGLLRFDATPVDGGLNRGNLVNNTLTAFFEPLNSNPGGAGQVDFGAQKGKPNLIPAQCDLSQAYSGCTATITGLPAGVHSVTLRLSSLYQTSNLQIQAISGSGVALPLIGVQASIDATGKAQDVLRRIQVRLPLVRSLTTLPGYAVESNGSICKRFLIRDDFFAVDGGIIDPDKTNPMCDSSFIDVPPQSCKPFNDIVFVLDASSSMNEVWNTTSGVTRIQELKAVTSDFITGSSISTTSNHAAIIDFNDLTRVDQTLTDNQSALLAAVNSLKLQPATHYLPALNAAYTEFQSSRVRVGAGKVMIFISDGEPNGSATKDQIRSEADLIKTAGVTTFTIGIGDPNDMDVQLLQDMASGSGRFANAQTPADLEKILNAISDAVTCT